VIQFLLAISFLLHLITLLALFVLFQRRTLERANIPSMKEDVETIHESIQAFVDELEKENEVLYENMLQYTKNKEKSWEARIRLVEEKTHQDEQMLNKSNKKTEVKKVALKGRTIGSIYRAKPMIDEASPKVENTTTVTQSSNATIEQSLVNENLTVDKAVKDQLYLNIHDSDDEEEHLSNYQKATDLYNQGFSVDQISKLLKIGKGETQLLVNMLNKQRSIQNEK
jgi:hypothetical protein